MSEHYINYNNGCFQFVFENIELDTLINKRLKKVVARAFWLLVVLVVMSTSCDHSFFVNGGYPTNVFIGADGGTDSIRGVMNDAPYIWAEGTSGYCTRDTIDEQNVVVRHGWLSVKYALYAGVMTITAEPNISGKRRHATISGMNLDESVDVDVYQGKK